MNPIQFKCSGDHYFTLDNLFEFQGELKKRTKKDIDKIKKSIKKHGFVAPFFYFVKDGKNFVLDGHGRLQACRELISDGIFFEGAFPCVEIKIDTEEEAKEILLKINSQYGKMTKESIIDFIGDIDMDLTNFDFSGINFDEEKELDFNVKESYQILIDCENESEQELLFNEFKQKGLKIKLV